jgi:branched-chain amino acid transport system substrate-binding protein
MKRATLALAVALFVTAAPAQILVGQTAGFSGPVAAGVEETTAGARLVIDAVNAAGGIDGERIELVSLDDGFVP